MKLWNRFDVIIFILFCIFFPTRRLTLAANYCNPIGSVPLYYTNTTDQTLNTAESLTDLTLLLKCIC